MNLRGTIAFELRYAIAVTILTFNIFYRCSWSEIGKSKYLKNFEAEIKIRGMQRYADTHAFGLDYLIESEIAKYIGCDFD